MWCVISIAALISFILFFLILWHLGTKDKLCEIRLVNPGPLEESKRSETVDLSMRGFQEFLSKRSDSRVSTDLDAEIWSVFLKPSQDEDEFSLGASKNEGEEEINFSSEPTRAGTSDK